MTPAPPAIALVVCTRDRAAHLPACLAALRALRPAVPWEIVLVDNGSRDATPRLLAEFAAAPPAPVTLVHEPRPGLACARNAGVARARAPLLAFADDDCYPAPDLLDRWLEVFADARVGYGGGRILLHDPADYPITIRTDPEPHPVPPFGFVPPGVVQGANMAFRRDVVLALGGFDPALGPGARFNFEDLDACSRAAAAGHAGGYFPGPTVRHHHRRRLADDVARLRRSYDHGRGAYYASLLLGRTTRRHGARAVRGSVLACGRGMAPAIVARELAAVAHYAAYRLVRRPERPLAAAG